MASAAASPRLAADAAEGAETGELLSAAALHERVRRYRAPLATKAAAGDTLAEACWGEARPAAG
jgi:hypothetical protein